jgi:hypothetical protein
MTSSRGLGKTSSRLSAATGSGAGVGLLTVLGGAGGADPESPPVTAQVSVADGVPGGGGGSSSSGRGGDGGSREGHACNGTQAAGECTHPAPTACNGSHALPAAAGSARARANGQQATAAAGLLGGQQQQPQQSPLERLASLEAALPVPR